MLSRALNISTLILLLLLIQHQQRCESFFVPSHQLLRTTLPESSRETSLAKRREFGLSVSRTPSPPTPPSEEEKDQYNNNNDDIDADADLWNSLLEVQHEELEQFEKQQAQERNDEQQEQQKKEVERLGSEEQVLKQQQQEEPKRQSSSSSSSSASLRRKERNVNLKLAANELKRARKHAANAQIVDNLFAKNKQVLSKGSKKKNKNQQNRRPLIDVSLVGHGIVGKLVNPNHSIGNQVGKLQPIRCLFLATPETSNDVILDYISKRYVNHGGITYDDSIIDVPDVVISKRYANKNNKDKEESAGTTRSTGSGSIPAIPLPIPLTREVSKELKLLSFAFRGRYISKSVFLPLAQTLINRDYELWDNLPWTSWTIDPQYKARDQHTKRVLPDKYLLGKRDAYNYMIGRDWYGRSISIGNTAARLKYNIEDLYDNWLEDTTTTTQPNHDDEKGGEKDFETKSATSNNFEMESSLALRILQLQCQEADMELAEAERQYAMMKTRLNEFDFSDETLMKHYNVIQASVEQVEKALESKQMADDALQRFIAKTEKDDSSNDGQQKTQLESAINEFLTGIVNTRFFDEKTKENVAPGDDDDDETKDKTKSTFASSITTNSESVTQKFVNELREQKDLMDDLNTIFDREKYNLVTSVKGSVIDFLDAIIERETKNAPPYRGAIGYSPQVDTKEEMFVKSLLPYRSPYDLLNEIIQEQLNAEVVGAVLENSSLFPGTLILEGAIVIRRRGRPKTVKIGNEEINIEDSEDTFGNDNVKMGDTMIVECAGEEAIGMAITCDVPISVERKIWNEVVADIQLSHVTPLKINETESVMNTIPPVKPVNPNSVTVTEGGEALIGGQQNQQQKRGGGDTTKDGTSVDDVMQEESVKSISSIADFDALSVPDKARIILTSGKLEGKLPRPRVLREFEMKLEAFKTGGAMSSSSSLEENSTEKEATAKTSSMLRTTLSPLDEILVPLIEDVSIQHEIRMRDAIIRNDKFDIETVKRDMEKLKEKKKREEDQKKK